MNSVKSVNVNNYNMHFEEWSQRLTNFKQSFNESEESLFEAESEVKVVEKEIQTKKSDIKKILNEISTTNEICRELNERFTKLLSEQRSLKFDVEVQEPKKVRSKESQEKLDAGHKTLHCYKHLTGVRLDFGDLENSLKGVVTNYESYLKNFDFPYDTVDLTEKLWELIYNAVKNHISNTRRIHA